MKKQFILVGAIAALGLGVFLGSCSKDDDDKGGVCACKVSILGHDEDLGEIDITGNPDGINSCSKLAKYLQKETEEETGYSGFTVTCKSK